MCDLQFKKRGFTVLHTCVGSAVKFEREDCINCAICSLRNAIGKNTPRPIS